VPACLQRLYEAASDDVVIFDDEDSGTHVVQRTEPRQSKDAGHEPLPTVDRSGSVARLVSP
jgi:hypothetical protein